MASTERTQRKGTGTSLRLPVPKEQRLICPPRGFGVWLMPDNRLPGMLEDFVRFMVRPDDRLWPRVEDVLQSIPENSATSSRHICPRPVSTRGSASRRTGKASRPSHYQDLLGSALFARRAVSRMASESVRRLRSAPFRLGEPEVSHDRFPHRTRFDGRGPLAGRGVLRRPDAAGRGELPHFRAGGCRRS